MEITAKRLKEERSKRDLFQHRHGWLSGSQNAPSAMGTDTEEDTCVKERVREIRERERKKEIWEEV